MREADPQLRPIVCSTWCFGPAISAAERSAIRHADVVGIDVYARIKNADAGAPASPRAPLAASDESVGAGGAGGAGLSLSALAESGGVGDEKTERRCVTLPAELRALARSVGRDAWITESQAEPWPPSKFDVDTMRWLVATHKAQGFGCVFLWGFEVRGSFAKDVWIDDPPRRSPRAIYGVRCPS